MLVSGFPKQDAPVSLGKQKTAEMPCELHRWDAGRVTVWVSVKYIMIEVFNCKMQNTEQWAESRETRYPSALGVNPVEGASRPQVEK